MTTEQFIEKAVKKHGNLYDYSLVNYQGCHSLVTINCQKHGAFLQKAFVHLVGCGCPICSGRKLSNTASFIAKARKIHGDRYDYSKVLYAGNKANVEIICPRHGSFIQSPNMHLKGHGCPKCWEARRAKAIAYSIEEFISRAHSIHGEKYDYSLIRNYRGQKQKLKIICPEHGIFIQTGDSHINKKSGCHDCAGKPRYTTEKFIRNARIVHGDQYDYSRAKYGRGNKDNVKIICKKHGTFFQMPNMHLSGHGCPSCNESKGERLIAWVLSKRKVEYVREKRFKNCRRVFPLSFDFYLPGKEICIEFDGEQHFRAREAFGGEKVFAETQERDQIKQAFCKENGIRLIRISFTEIDKIESILREAC